jgi:hypothetical protein
MSKTQIQIPTLVNYNNSNLSSVLISIQLKIKISFKDKVYGKRNNLSRLIIHKKKLKRSLITTNLKNPFAKSQEKSSKHKSKDSTTHTHRYTHRYTYRERFFKFYTNSNFNMVFNGRKN